jgi:hypothetical protein
MTDEDWLVTSRVKVLLLAALESPIGLNGSASLHSAADASSRLTALGRRLGAPGAGLLEQATAPTVTVPDLIAIKQAAKVLIQGAEEDEEREAAALLYHVAIAAAFCRFDLDVSGRPVKERRERYRQLAVQFSGFALGEIFRQAVFKMDTLDRG